MRNKLNLKKYLILCIIILIVFIVIFSIINWIRYNKYTKNVNIIISNIVENIQTQYPNVNMNDIIKILNSEEITNNGLLSQYGIDIEKDSVIYKNNEDYAFFMAINIGVGIILIIVVAIIFMSYQKSQNKKIKEITKYIEEINNKNYTLDIKDNDEDELSILKNELYKITVMLKEQAENSKNDKLGLKKSLEDISHQLKTPLTSITIMLDNILDNPDMEVNTRNEFIKDINREISNINFFVQTLLKLSKFDADTIVFNSRTEKLEDIIEESIKNVLPICDLKNIDIVVQNVISNQNEINIDKEQHKIEINKESENNRNYELHRATKENKLNKIIEPEVKCDLKWQIEAVTNILKNSVEHSKTNDKINIYFSENNMYSEIIIKDEGIGIDKQDLKHIFERFYKGKNSSKDSVGIGLALAKTIVEKDNGYITVESEINKGTSFYIRYLK